MHGFRPLTDKKIAQTRNLSSELDIRIISQEEKNLILYQHISLKKPDRVNRTESKIKSTEPSRTLSKLN